MDRNEPLKPAPALEKLCAALYCLVQYSETRRPEAALDAMRQLEALSRLPELDATTSDVAQVLAVRCRQLALCAKPPRYISDWFLAA
jgi:hypothetical protein